MNHIAGCRSMILMKKMQSAECRLLELTLLLDKNPDDQTALRQYNETAERRKAVESSLGVNHILYRHALPAMTTSSINHWNWNRTS
ncbi:spore coat protein CotJB [Gorillibacterium massiliense]|uniref:spore coat protein CotJB n=1 Tax=Gorillibacterium massiliense TaxID=1280390 RepID=UPI0004B7E423|nr:spore coat protein CotJB [Gorillibacterium massiliense]